MFENDMLLDILGKGWLVTDKPSGLDCPKCEDSRLHFHLDAHLNLARGIDFPAVGENVDGYIKKNGNLDIPWFTLDAANVIHDIPADLQPGQRITTRVREIATGEPTDTVQTMFYRHVVTDLSLQYVKSLAENRR